VWVGLILSRWSSSVRGGNKSLVSVWSDDHDALNSPWSFCCGDDDIMRSLGM
jgi:hypothetical protein